MAMGSPNTFFSNSISAKTMFEQFDKIEKLSSLAQGGHNSVKYESQNGDA